MVDTWQKEEIQSQPQQRIIHIYWFWIIHPGWIKLNSWFLRDIKTWPIKNSSPALRCTPQVMNEGLVRPCVWINSKCVINLWNGHSWLFFVLRVAWGSSLRNANCFKDFVSNNSFLFSCLPRINMGILKLVLQSCLSWQNTSHLNESPASSIQSPSQMKQML